MKRIFASLAVGALSLAACSKSTTTAAPSTAPSTAAPSAVTIQATEFQFLMPATIAAGVTTMHVQNIGGMPHFFEIQSVDAGKTDGDISAFFKSPAAQGGSNPSWLAPTKDIPSIPLLSPGQSTDVTMNLVAGRYALFCWMPDANGTPHALLGMHKVFDVTGTAQGTLPSGTLTVTADDGGIKVPDTIATGTQTIVYANSGSKTAGVTIVRLNEDKPLADVKKDVDAWFKSAYAGPAPAEFLGGLGGIPAGSTNAGLSTVNFVPGVYAFVPDGKAMPEVRTVGGGGFPSPSAAVAVTDCTPSGSTLSITAKAIAFSTSCLAAPADAPFTITFDNQDASVPHNVAIYPDAAGSKAVFAGDLVTGPKMMTYEVTGLPAGTYRFQCDVHPTTMSGTFIVK